MQTQALCMQRAWVCTDRSQPGCSQLLHVVTAPQQVGVLTSAAAWHMGSGVGLGIAPCAGHRACSVHLAWPRGREWAVSHTLVPPVWKGWASYAQGPLGCWHWCFYPVD